jgi:uncharacterized protein YceK
MKLFMRNLALSFCVLLMLSGCTSVPVAVTYRGHSLNGSGDSSPDMSTFSFKVSDDTVACRGSYALAPAFAQNFTFPISCSDGRTGTVEANRGAQAMDLAGTDFPVNGKINFSDGAIGMFNLGDYARSINTKSLIYNDFIEGITEKKFQ